MALMLSSAGVAMLQLPVPVARIDAVGVEWLAEPAKSLVGAIACSRLAIRERNGPREWQPRVDPVDDGVKHRSRFHLSSSLINFLSALNCPQLNLIVCSPLLDR